MDVTAGIFELGRLLVTPRTTEQTMLKSVPTAEPMIFNGAYHSYSLPPAIIGDVRFLASLWFAAGRLAQLHLTMHDDEAASWSHWSTAAELELKGEHDRWLRDQAGHAPPYDYAWGAIASEYDPRSGSSAIIVVYGQH